MSRGFLQSQRTLERDERGATLLEFAMVSPVLMLLVMGTVELSLVAAAQNLIESATFSASRVGKTQEAVQEDVILDELDKMAGILVDPAKIEITSLAYTNFDVIGEPEPFVDANGNRTRDNGENYTDSNGNGQYDEDRGAAGYGGTSQIVVYTVSCRWKLFTPLIGDLIGTEGVVTLTSRMVVKNEPY